MKNRSASWTAAARRGTWSAWWTMAASRWQADPVGIGAETMPARSSRSASSAVARSPLTAARRCRPSSARAVASSSAVLPEPGEPMTLSASTPAATKCWRRWAAWRSLCASSDAPRSMATRCEPVPALPAPQPQTSHIGHLQLETLQDQRAPGAQLRVAITGVAAEWSLGHHRGAAALARPVRALDLDGEHGARVAALVLAAVERGPKQADVDAGQLADAHHHQAHGRRRMP